ncbi:sigma-70 family RNA polymerase sigma factor [Bacillus sp. JCM 19034]|uniref:sigma-70 family RNA polymerase sigma factor n=1 Tax=Bacillus sp. JCM 19034 TaxID=1481928 RepID=UPI0007855F0C|nr:sigma-70 family RNA polymerase sigma factor [Bacillus sp. JCM 19034]
MNEIEQDAIVAPTINEREQMLDHLMDEYSDAIVHLVFTYVKDHATAEDLTQDIFIKCYQKLDQFNNHSSLKTWVYRVAINHCKDYIRSWHYRKISLTDMVFDIIPSKSRQVEEEIVKNSEEQELADSVISLPIPYREVVFLHYYEELTLAEISKMTGVNVNTLKTRLKRAKELLKERMKEDLR